MKLSRKGDASPMGAGPMRYGPMTAVLFLVLGFALSSILQSLGSLNMSPNSVESSFFQLYQSFGRLLPFCNGPNVLAVVQEDRVNASLGILAEKLSRVEALADQGNSALKDLSAHFAAPGNGMTAGQCQEALARIEAKLNQAQDSERTLKSVAQEDEDAPTEEEVHKLWGEWSSLYAVGDPHHKGSPIVPPGILRPPHLQDCAKVTADRTAWETRREDGSLPLWHSGHIFGKGDGGVNTPQPPWVKGADIDNIPSTRQAQADIWAHQHPPDCHDPQLRFLVADWWAVEVHGLGSQLHGWTILLAAAMLHDRVLVLPHKYYPASHDGCDAERQKDSLACFFLDFVSEECRTVGLDLYERNQSVARNAFNASAELVDQSLASDARVYFISESFDRIHYWLYTDRAPSVWGTPWLKESVLTLENQGKLFHADERRARMSWWRAQATRYLLRWPSTYLCRLTNRERHLVYGKQVARDVLAAKQRQRRILTDSSYGGLMKGELETTFWSPEEWGPFLPQPCISVHVRQGDKAFEMEIYDFGAFMAQAERIRRHNPSVRTIWLSTEMETVINETRHYPAWDFLYTRGLPRVSEHRGIGRSRDITDQSFVNLVIAAECEYFVGVPGSNWNRLIDELRRTSGKRRNAHIALNMGEAK